MALRAHQRALRPRVYGAVGRQTGAVRLGKRPAHRAPATLRAKDQHKGGPAACTKIDEVCIGSCISNIGYFRTFDKLLAGTFDISVKLWAAQHTKMDDSELLKVCHYANFPVPMPPRKCRATRFAWEIRRKYIKMSLCGLHLHAQLPQSLGLENQRVSGQ